MRLWTIHPMYLDRAGLVALWREALLAKKVLEGRTKGYTMHPQLDRFRRFPNKINNYLMCIWHEAIERDYNFDPLKIGECVPGIDCDDSIIVPSGQIYFELNHLFSKLEKRDKQKLEEIYEIVFGDVYSPGLTDMSPHCYKFSFGCK